MLLGRVAECDRLDGCLTSGRAGHSAAVLLRGEAGIGKTALLDYVAERADGWRVTRASGVESEMELPFAGVHQLCATMLGDLDRLPAPQADALATAFGLKTGPPPDRFLIGLAVLTLLSNTAEQRPLLCLVDDVHWLDLSSVQILAFVARRLQAESVVIVFAEREPRTPDELVRLPEVRLTGLSQADAATLLRATIAGPLDEQVRDRLLLETRGVPLALLELPGDAGPADLAGGYGLPSSSTLSQRIEETYRRRIRLLPKETQLLALAAAAEPTGEATLLWRAAALLDVPPEALDPAQDVGLITVGAQVAFRHPLMRTAVYAAASGEEQRRVHQALATATDAAADPDRRAWHLAHATVDTNDEVAEELERSASRAQARGGLAAAAAFLERAVALTSSQPHRARRALEAARAKQLAGAPEAALRLLATAAAGPFDPLHSATLTHLHGLIALDQRRGNDAVPLLLDAASRLEQLDPNLSRHSYMDAIRAASMAGRLGDGILTATRASRQAPPPIGPPRGVDLLLDGLALRFTDGYVASAGTLKRALAVIREEGNVPADTQPADGRWPWLARRVAPDLFDDETWHAVASRSVQLARSTGALGLLPLALNALAGNLAFQGRLDEARRLLDEADVISEATNTTPILFGKLLVAAWPGDEDEPPVVAPQTSDDLAVRGEGVILSFAEGAYAIHLNGLGRYAEALIAASSASAVEELMVSVLALPELVEAATRSGQPDTAEAALDRLTERTQAAGTELALGIEARSRALLLDGPHADELYEEAVHRLALTTHRPGLARAQLLYGEWLRRQNHRVAARAQLHAAHDSLTAMGINGFAERARRELLATGETVRKRGANEPEAVLTSQEAQIASLAAEGRTNPEIGAQLFISPRTVEWHLRKTFNKLGITSRRQLRNAISGTSSGLP
jgi:DNA-binding CsgD family transcriptional regulator/tetratricopeptide (TPR) repeat protein